MQRNTERRLRRRVSHHGARELRARRSRRSDATQFEPVTTWSRRWTSGSSIYDKIGLQDMTTDDTYFERGINLLHGYLAEYYADSADYIVRVPKGLSQVGVLLNQVASRRRRSVRLTKYNVACASGNPSAPQCLALAHWGFSPRSFSACAAFK